MKCAPKTFKEFLPVHPQAALGLREVAAVFVHHQVVEVEAGLVHQEAEVAVAVVPDPEADEADKIFL